MLWLVVRMATNAEMRQDLVSLRKMGTTTVICGFAYIVNACGLGSFVETISLKDVMVALAIIGSIIVVSQLFFGDFELHSFPINLEGNINLAPVY